MTLFQVKYKGVSIENKRLFPDVPCLILSLSDSRNKGLEFGGGPDTKMG